MIARNPTSSEVDKAAEIAAKAFSGLPLEHWLESFRGVAEHFGREYVLVVEIDGELMSSLLCCPEPVMVNGGAVTHTSTGAVGTLPECRNKGCAGAMMAECVRLLRRQDICLSSLWPFSYEYYRKFGWEVGAESRSYSAQGSVFAQFGDPGNARGATRSDAEQVKSVYNRFMRGHNCLTLRGEEWWNRLVKLEGYLQLVAEPGRGMIVHETGGEIDGYIAYEIGEKDEQKRVEAKEVAFIDPAHRRDMLALLGTLNPEGPVSFGAAGDDLFLQELPNPRVVQASVHPSFQFRVIDPEGAMAALRTPEDVSGKLTFALTDPVFEEGFEFGAEIDGGRVTIGRPDSRGRLEMSVQTLARLYSGYLKADDALRMGMVKGSAEAVDLARRAFPPLSPYRSWLEPG